jgi:hypothetical protein
MRRTAAALIACAIPALVTGCGGDDSRPTAAATATSSPATSTATATVTPATGSATAEVSGDPEVALLLQRDWANASVPYITEGVNRGDVQLSQGYFRRNMLPGLGGEVQLREVFAGRLGGVPTALVLLQEHHYGGDVDDRDVQAVIYRLGDDPANPYAFSGYIHNDTPDAIEGGHEFAYRMEGDVLTQFRRPSGSGAWSAFSASVVGGEVVGVPSPEPLPRESDWTTTGVL